MRELFLGIPVAVLVGLFTLAFQPWTPQWAAGIFVSASVFLVTVSHTAWRSAPEWFKLRFGRNIKATIGIAILCAMFGGLFLASHWPTGFLKTEKPSSGYPPEPTGPLMSSMDDFVLRCNIPPPPPTKTPLDSLWELQDYKQKLDIIGDAIGVRFTLHTIRGGVSLEAEAVTDEAKHRMPLSQVGVTKMTLEIRRVDTIELVNVIVKLPPQLSFYGLLTPNLEAPDTILLVRTIERFLGVSAGTCRVV
jgi:hypothetical protein